MWNVRFFEVIPAAVFLFCLLEVFELVLIINDMNKTEKLEAQLRQNLEMLKIITDSRHCLETFKDKKIKTK